MNVLGGLRLGRPGADLESALRRADFADLDEGEPLDPSIVPLGQTPASSDGRLGYSVAVGYAVDRHWEIRGLVSGEQALHSHGASVGLYRLWLKLDATSSRYAATVAYRPGGSLLRIGAGPALASGEVTAAAAYERHPSDSATRLGLVLEAGVSYPRRSRVYADLGMQQWFVGALEYGPYDVQNGIGHIERVFPRSSYSLSRTYLALSVGVRI